jgi:TatD DNase family protein
LNQIDLKDIVLETDSPYFSNSFSRENESSYLLNVIDKLAIIYNLTAKEIATLLQKKRFSVFKINLLKINIFLFICPLKITKTTKCKI